MSSPSIRKSVVGRISLNADDEDGDLAYLQDIVSMWSQPHDCIVTRTAHHDGCRADVRFDWSPVAAVLKQQLEMTELFRHSPTELPPDWWEAYSREVRIPVTVEVHGSNKLSNYHWYPDFFIENALYDLFVVVNLALPSAADF